MKFDLYLNYNYLETCDSLEKAIKRLEENEKNNLKARRGDYIELCFDNFVLQIEKSTNYEYTLYLKTKNELDAFAFAYIGKKTLSNALTDIINYKNWCFYFDR